MAETLVTMATGTNHYQMKDSPNIRCNTENSIALSLIVLILWSKINILIVAAHLVTMVTGGNWGHDLNGYRKLISFNKKNACLSVQS